MFSLLLRVWSWPWDSYILNLIPEGNYASASFQADHCYSYHYQCCIVTCLFNLFYLLVVLYYTTLTYDLTIALKIGCTCFTRQQYHSCVCMCVCMNAYGVPVCMMAVHVCVMHVYGPCRAEINLRSFLRRRPFCLFVFCFLAQSLSLTWTWLS